MYVIRNGQTTGVNSVIVNSRAYDDSTDCAFAFLVLVVVIGVFCILLFAGVNIFLDIKRYYAKKSHKRPIMTRIVRDYLITTADASLICCSVSDKNDPQHNTCLWKSNNGRFFVTENDDAATIRLVGSVEVRAILEAQFAHDPHELIRVIREYVDKHYSVVKG